MKVVEVNTADLKDKGEVTLISLIGKELTNFKIAEYTEVYKMDDDGRKAKSIGCFTNEDIAKAFAQNQVDKDWHQTSKVLILTDGVNGFLLDKVEPVKIFSDEKAVFEIKQKALKKLSAEEIKVLGI